MIDALTFPLAIRREWKLVAFAADHVVTDEAGVEVGEAELKQIVDVSVRALLDNMERLNALLQSAGAENVKLRAELGALTEAHDKLKRDHALTIAKR